jgi:hypothetical protein
METILDRLVDDLKRRQSVLRGDRHRHTFYLKELDPNELIQIAYTHMLRGLERKATLVEIVTSIGRRIRQRNKQQQDSVLDAHTGWFVVISFLECGIVKYRMAYTYSNGKRAKHQSYYLAPLDWNAIKHLWTLIDKTKVDRYPSQKPYADWIGPTHSETGDTIIKKINARTLPKFPIGEDLMVYRIINKLQRQSWNVNREVFAVYQQAMRMKDEKNSPFKYSKEIDPKKRRSLEMEVEAIEQIALACQNAPFYHLYNYDFRGRVYVNTAYLHEQSSDNAKGLLLFGEASPLGAHGAYWLRVHTSNCFGNDKVRLSERSSFVLERTAEFISFATDPFVNKGWMHADKPFCFLACCFELARLNKWTKDGHLEADFPSALPLYIDGSNNGVQHLAAMALDEVVAPLVNLVPQDLPGDVYKYIAQYAWKDLEELAAKLTQTERDQFDDIFRTARELQRKYSEAPANSEEKALAYAAASEWRNANRDIRAKLFPIYWLNINNPKDQRKVVKRNVMTLGYGGTAYGMGQQIIDDTRDMSEYLRDKEHLWGALLGNLVFNTCYSKLPGPARMLRLFQEFAKRSGDKEEDLCWTVPGTNFPVVQIYRKPTTKRVKLTYGDDELKLQLMAWESAVMDKDGQVTGTAPNLVHSFDAGHLGTVVDAATYHVSVVHDSFGCHAGNMQDMFMLTRIKFVEFYLRDPLMMVLKENGAEDLEPVRGQLDIMEILNSDYAFC